MLRGRRVFPTRIAVISMNAIEAADALDGKQAIILSRDLSPQAAEHFFAVTEDVPGEAMEMLSGEYLTKVFLGPYKDAPKWEEEIESYVAPLSSLFDSEDRFGHSPAKGPVDLLRSERPKGRGDFGPTHEGRAQIRHFG
ncbi:MAG: hypothetical protein MI753_10420, partial [Hyphomicrobiales bacterium]|nr:hypothetical protein [Hyphomicrobiales bacterium]